MENFWFCPCNEETFAVRARTATGALRAAWRNPVLRSKLRRFQSGGLFATAVNCPMGATRFRIWPVKPSLRFHVDGHTGRLFIDP